MRLQWFKFFLAIESAHSVHFKDLFNTVWALVIFESLTAVLLECSAASVWHGALLDDFFNFTLHERPTEHFLCQVNYFVDYFVVSHIIVQVYRRLQPTARCFFVFSVCTIFPFSSMSLFYLLSLFTLSPCQIVETPSGRMVDMVD